MVWKTVRLTAVMVMVLFRRAAMAAARAEMLPRGVPVGAVMTTFLPLVFLILKPRASSCARASAVGAFIVMVLPLVVRIFPWTVSRSLMAAAVLASTLTSLPPGVAASFAMSRSSWLRASFVGAVMVYWRVPGISLIL